MWSAVIWAIPGGNVGIGDGIDIATSDGFVHEAGFNTDWIEKCLAHEQRGVRAVYNKAEYAEQRRAMLQARADMLDGWIATKPKASVLALAQPAKTREYIS